MEHGDIAGLIGSARSDEAAHLFARLFLRLSLTGEFERLRASKNFELIAPSKASPIDSETLRCATLPIEQADDPKCQALWAAQRRKFLAPKKQDDDSGAAPKMFPSVPRALEKPAEKSAPAQSE
jgi:conjugative transfer region protein TrbK